MQKNKHHKHHMRLEKLLEGTETLQPFPLFSLLQSPDFDEGSTVPPMGLRAQWGPPFLEASDGNSPCWGLVQERACDTLLANEP